MNQISDEDVIDRLLELRDEIERECIQVLTRKAGKPDRWARTEELQKQLGTARDEIVRRDLGGVVERIIGKDA